MQKFYALIFSLLMVGWAFSTVLVAVDVVPKTITFEVVLATQKQGLLVGDKVVRIQIGPNGTVETTPLWSSTFTASFVNGRASFVLGAETNELTPTHLLNPNTVIYLEVDELSHTFPIPSAPYAIIAHTAETVEEVDASTISGTFVTTLNIQNDVRVIDSNGSSVFFVDQLAGNVGIGTDSPSPDYALDVNGTVNAGEYLLDGESLYDQTFFWEKQAVTGTSKQPVFYNAGSVGIGTDSPSPDYALDVQGTVNASEFLVNTQPLEDYLAAQSRWKDVDKDNSNDIYFTSGNIGIGRSTGIVERLDVSGAIRISDSVQSDSRNKIAGTIEYNTTDQDFYAYGVDGRLFSLTGAQVKENFIPSENQLAIWTDDQTLISTKNLMFSGGQLSVGTDNASALLTVEGDGNLPYMDIRDQDGTSVFVIDATGNIGIATSNPLYALDVNGTVDASHFFVNGNPLQTAFSAGSFWTQGNSGDDGTDLFYEHGNVGIGTRDPSSLLEIQARENNDVELTFGIGADDLFSMGVKADDVGKFVISKGSDLDDPIFVFSSKNIGVGTLTPVASLHVSGNAGFLAEGPFKQDDEWTATGNNARMFFFPGRSVFRAGRARGTQWNDEALGDYSTAFGLDNIASGNYSFVGGGRGNTAAGDFAFIPGGIGNEAVGDYSFAGGYYAKALHKGSFVWADSTPSSDDFASVGPNQFLVRAFGGVGINTTETSEASVVVSRRTPGTILALKSAVAGSTGTKVLVNTEGKMGVNTTELGTASLAVQGKVGIGTTTPKGLLHIEGSETSEDYLLYVHTPLRDTQLTSNVVVVTSTGNVGIGTTVPSSKLEVVGKIEATGFLMRDAETGETITIQSNDSPWTLDDEGLNAFRTHGFVGIGTLTPNSLLELSNQNSVGAMPVIAFDVSNTDIAKMGVILDADGLPYFAIASSENFTEELATFVITQNSVVIGQGVATSDYVLDVTGTMNVTGKLAIGTDNIHENYDLFVDGILAVSTINIGGAEFTLQSDAPWKTASGGTGIYSTANAVGIGTNSPSEQLEVVGTVSMNRLIMPDTFTLNGDLTTGRVNLEDTQISDVFGAVYVENSNLVYEDSDGLKKELSSDLERSSEVGSGPLAFWANKSTIGKIPVYWNDSTRTLEATANVIISNYYDPGDGLVVSTNVGFRDDKGMVVVADMAHKGDSSVIGSYTLHDLSVSIQSDWGKPDSNTQIKGISVALGSDEDADKLFNGASATGMIVDVSKVELATNEGSTASKYAAIFKGGNVGIGVDDPTALLEVNGVISANMFNISGELVVNGLTVDDINNALYVETDGTDPRVGIGTNTPQSELDVRGTVSANNVIVAGELKSVSVNIGTNAFVVDVNGNIGIGTATPSASFHVVEEISVVMSAPFTAEKVDIVIDGVEGRDGTYFYYAQDLTGLKLGMESKLNSFIKDNEVKGLEVDLTDLTAQQSSKVYGVYVDVAGEGGTRHAAIFNGGNVGIGTDTPTSQLHISGDAYVSGDLILDGAVSINNTITVNHLIVQTMATLNNVTINNLNLLGDLEINKINFQSIEVDTATINTLISEKVTVTDLTVGMLSVTTNFTADRGYFKQGLSVGTDNVLADTLYVKGNAKFTGDVESRSWVKAVTLNIGNGTFVIDDDGKIGLGTADPQSFVHVEVASPVAFDINNNQTYNAMRFGFKEDSVNDGDVIGLIFSPEQEPSENIGSAILAQKTVQGTGSDLIFITDPRNGAPKERVRLSSEGFMGVGTSTPGKTLDVSGNARISGDLKVGTLTVSKLESSSEITIDASLGVTINGHATFMEPVVVNGVLMMTPTDAVSVSTGGDDFGRLFVDSVDNDLYFIKPRNGSTSKVNLSGIFSGTPGKIPFFNPEGSVSDNAYLSWDGTTKQLKIGTQNALTTLQLLTTFDPDSMPKVADEIRVSFNNRASVAKQSKFVGMGIEMGSKQGNDSDFRTDYGRLGEGEVAIGLDVDLTGLADSSTEGQGYKYAAVFNGGFVGIGTDSPEALLHIKEESDLDGKPLFQITNQSAVSLMVVSNNGRVAFGSSVTDAGFSVQPLNVNDAILAVYTNANLTPAFFVSANGNVAIGTKNVSEALVVSGNVAADNAFFQDITAGSLTVKGTVTLESIGTDKVTANVIHFKPTSNISMLVDKGRLYVDSSDSHLYFMKPGSDIAHNLSGLLASANLGTVPFYDTAAGGALTTSGNFKFVENVLTLGTGTSVGDNLGLRVNKNSSGTSSDRGVSINMEFSGTAQTGTFHGVDIALRSATDGALGTNAVAYGLKVDLSDLNGAYYDLSGTELNVRKYAGLFSGGLVGVGTVSPEATFHVKADSDLYLPGSTQADDYMIFRVDTETQTKAFVVDKDGKVGIGGADPVALLSIKPSTDPGAGIALFSVKTDGVGGSEKFVVSDNVRIGGSLVESSSVALAVSGNVLFGTAVAPIMSVYVASKSVGIGQFNPVATLDIKVDDGNVALRVAKDDSNVYLKFDGNQRLGLGRFEDATIIPYALSVFDEGTDGAVVMASSTSNLSGLTLPASLTGTASSAPKGFLTTDGTQYSFLGLDKDDESALVFGGQSSTPTFNISSGNKELMTFSTVGIGIGTSNISASLHVVSSNSTGYVLKVGDNALVVSANGFVGIATGNPTVALDVAGTLRAENFQVTQGGITVNTMTVEGQFQLEDTIAGVGSNGYSSVGVTLNLGSDLDKNFYGMKINMASLVSTDDDLKKLIYGGAQAVGLHVDMSSLALADADTGTYGESNFGNKYAAMFKGGNVGIGTTSPEYPLHVQGNSGEIIAGFGGTQSDVVIRDYTEGVLAINVVGDANLANSYENVGIVFVPVNSTVGGESPALVGIGTKNPDKALVVNGDMRLGVKTSAQSKNAYGRYGSKLFFSGGPSIGSVDSDMDDDLFIARFNKNVYDSQLRVNFSTVDTNALDEAGVGKGNDQFVVGYTQSGSYLPVLKVHNNQTVSVFGLKDDPAGDTFVADATFHVVGQPEAVTGLAAHSALIENRSTSGGHALGLYYSMPGNADDRFNFVTFFNNGDAIGAIEGNGSDAVRYKTGGADYAEYLPKATYNETFESGDVVGVYNGEISKDTSKSQQLMVISSTAGVAGNWPGDDVSGVELVAFYGQVPAKVLGTVEKGDYIVASGQSDGVGISVSAANLSTAQRSQIIGRAWESSAESGVKLVLTAVGFAFGERTLHDELEQIELLEHRLSQLEGEKALVLQSYQDTFERQSAEIDALLSQFETTP